MVKLLRLTHNKQDTFDNAPEGLTFNVNMEDDLIVSENAQIGVKNLTFEADYQILNINPANDTISAKYETSRDASTDRLTAATYVKSTYRDFFADLNITLNNCVNPLLVDPSTSAATSNKQGFYGQYNVDADSQYKPINFKLTPALNPVINRLFENPQDPGAGGLFDWQIVENLMTSIGETISIDYNQTLPTNQLKPSDMCIIKSAKTDAAGTRVNFLASARPDAIWSRGSAVWSIRIGALSLLADGGFEIGLASAIPFDKEGTPIADDDIKFAVRVTGSGDDFRHIKPTSDFTSNPVYVVNTGISPSFPIPANSAESDTIVLSCSHRSNTAHRKKLTAEVFRDGLAVETLFSYDFPKGKEDTPLFPYLCMFEPTANPTNAHSPVVTFDLFELDDNTDINLLQGNQFAGAGVFSEASINYGTDGYFNLENGGANWTQAPAPATENFVTTNLGDIADYRRTQQGTPGLLQWWEATGANTWNVYNGSSTGGLPPTATSVPDATATTDAQGIISIVGSTTTFTPTTIPNRVEKIGRIGLPDLNELWYGNLGLAEKSSLILSNRVLLFLGFTKDQLSGGIEQNTQFPVIINTTRVPYGFTITPDGLFALTQSDNFVVILDSQKLVSYDCSVDIRDVIDVKGKRANILATIPVNDNDGIIEFQANEVLFIDMDNKQPMAIKNLSLRVLDKELEPIQVEGLSVMTLLIKD